MCERLAAAGVLPTHAVFRRAAAALRDAAEREPDAETVHTALAAARRVEAATYLGRGDMPRRYSPTDHYVTTDSLPLTAHCLLLTNHCSPRTAHCARLPTAPYSLLTTSLTAYYLLTLTYCRDDISLRPSVWLWRRAIKLRKTQAPATLCAGGCNPMCCNPVS